jgi:predicted PurR-regulated permease PerM
MRASNGSKAALSSFVVLLLICTVLFLWLCSKYLLPVIMGQVLALASLGPHRLLARRLPARAAAVLVCLGWLVLVIAPIGLFVTVAARDAAELSKSFGDGDGTPKEKLDGFVKEAGQKIGEPEELRKQAKEALGKGAKVVSMGALAAAKALPAAALHLALLLLACYFFLLDGGRLPSRLLGLIPFDEDIRDELEKAISETSMATLKAGFAAAMAQSAVILAAFLVLRLPSPFLAAGVTFVAAWVPMLGTIPAVLGGALYLGWEGDWGRLAGLAAFGVVAGLADNVARPLVLKGGGDRLHPLVSLIAIFGGIELFGFFGVFVGPILAAVVFALYGVWPSIAARYGMRVKHAVPTPAERS